ncbi:AraC family transcriptional regulator [Thalassomonas actiniarum]|uniref:Helix-turn-helix transcriptional regulator n=1 Tax=Thalassomonas actiniarum TaxID=485447 RepID=A0AAF0C3J6_9GAMM|nr:helix-turn-helix domain-containing protein [Thalassomonas actiniarum]WDD99637.1 helix-turn-helix transcriptional regulator [Thalassomonas actiniarum]
MLRFHSFAYTGRQNKPMTLSFPDIFDLLLRFLAVGQLSLLCLYILSNSRQLKALLGSSLAVCLSAYLLLTAPVPDHHYGILRGILLFFTELTPYLLWYFAFSLLNKGLIGENLISEELLKERFHPKHWPLAVKALVAGAILWFLYFFGYLQGRGLFHDINHGLQLILLLHIIFIAVKDLRDDLVTARRNSRLVLTLASCVYFSLTLLLELGDASLRDATVFSITNASLVLLSTSVFGWYYFRGSFKDISPLPATADNQQEITDAAAPEIPVEYQAIYQQLCQRMADGFYMQSQLTITALASELTTPEHQLRKLINQHLGFRNFSDFLNSYRLVEACSQLEDIEHIRKPILTLALELGYGSVATFNRAFKAKTGKSPKEYRDHFQK